MKCDSFKVLLLLVSILSVLSCNIIVGKDGTDGEAYIAYSYSSDTEITFTDDPAFPIIAEIQDGVYEKTVPGTYNFEYTDNSTWAGDYTVYVNEGMDGGLFVDGLNGKDVYFELYMYSSGPSFYDWTEPRAAIKQYETNKVLDEIIYIEKIVKGKFTIILKYQKMN